MLPVALLALVLGTTGEVSPEAVREAQELAHRSALEYDLGHAQDALHDLEQAYLLDPRPGLLFNLGQCHRMLKHWEQAETAYRGYLRHQPNAPNREQVRELIEEMRRNQAQLLQSAVRAREASQRPVAAAAATPQAAPPPPASTTLVLPAPFEATAETPKTASHGTAWPWVLGGAAVVAAGFSVWGWLQVSSFENLRGSSTVTNPTPASQAQSAQSLATVGETVGIIGIVAAVGFATGMGLTW